MSRTILAFRPKSDTRPAPPAFVPTYRTGRLKSRTAGAVNPPASPRPAGFRPDRDQSSHDRP